MNSNVVRSHTAHLIRRNGGWNNNGYTYPVEFSLRLPQAPAIGKVLTVLREEFPDEAARIDDQAARGRIMRRMNKPEQRDVAVCNMHLDILQHPAWRSPMEHVSAQWDLQKMDVTVEFDIVGIEGGTHLVVKSFQGIDLSGWSAMDLADAIDSFQLGSDQWARELGCMVQEWTEAFSAEGLLELVEFHLAGLAAESIRKAYDSRLRFSAATLSHIRDNVDIHRNMDDVSHHSAR